MAGRGFRFLKEGYKKPKPLIDVHGTPMIEKCIASLGLEGQYIFIVRKYENELHNEELRSVLTKMVVNPIIIEINEVTEGAACTCLLAREHINNNAPLISVNCDQILEWDSENFLQFLEEKAPDGAVVTYDSNSNKNSYIELDENGNGIRLAEKDPISEHSLTGIHYWKEGKHFVNSANSMIKKNERVNNEFYVAPTYNEMISQGMIVVNYRIENHDFHPVGTPEDLNIYLRKKATNENL